MRDRFIRAIKDISKQPIMLDGLSEWAEDIADELIDYGVIVPPCKVGDKVYQTDGVRVYESTITDVIYNTCNIAFDERAIGKTVFLTREEAEVALAEREGKV